MTDVEAWLAQNTLYCPRLLARMSAKQCAENRARRSVVEGYDRDEHDTTACKPRQCEDCPGIEALNVRLEPLEEDVAKNKKRVKCLDCGKILPHVAQGLCSACYNNWYYKKEKDPEYIAALKRKREEEESSAVASENEACLSPDEVMEDNAVSAVKESLTVDEETVSEAVKETLELLKTPETTGSRADTAEVTAPVMGFDLSEFEDVRRDGRFDRCAQPRLHVHRDRLYLNPLAQNLLGVQPGTKLLIKIHTSRNSMLIKPAASGITVQHGGNVQCRSLHRMISHHKGKRFALHQAQEGFVLAVLEQAA